MSSYLCLHKWLEKILYNLPHQLLLKDIFPTTNLGSQLTCRHLETAAHRFTYHRSLCAVGSQQLRWSSIRGSHCRFLMCVFGTCNSISILMLYTIITKQSHRSTCVLPDTVGICSLTTNWTRRFHELWDIKMLLDVLKVPCSWYSILNSEILQCTVYQTSGHQLKCKFDIVAGPRCMLS